MTAKCNRDCFQCPFPDCALPNEDVSHAETRAADRRDHIARLISPQSYPRKPYEPQCDTARKYHQTHKPVILLNKQEYYCKNRLMRKKKKPCRCATIDKASES